MSLMVQKFGGSSLSSAEKVLHAAHMIKTARDAGYDVIAVLSAQGDTTDRLLSAAREINPEAPARELDMLLAAGEQMSAALCAAALDALGVPAVSLCAWQIPICSDDAHGDARIVRIGRERVEKELRARRAVLAAGFQAVDSRGDLTTLGRGGSDTSAVALAAEFGAERCRIYTDVDGVFTADPRICPDARRLERVSYEQMYRLAGQGAQVLHARCVALAQRTKVEIEVRSCEDGSVGTRVSQEGGAADITGVALRPEDDALAAVTAVGGALPAPEYERAALAALERSGIPVHSVREGEESLSFLVPRTDAKRALCAVHGALFPES